MTNSRLFPLVVLAFAFGCRGDDPPDDPTPGSPDNVGSICAVPGDCYPDVDPGDIVGEVECLDRVDEGYCTHRCEEDVDCCAVPGECVTDLAQVCSPFESVGYKMCFLSCEQADIDAAGAPDGQVFCQDHVTPEFICRSSGGGSENRDICVPGDCGVGAWCEDLEDCAPDLDCVDGIDAGWCGREGCATSDDCPGDSVCIAFGDGTLCVPACEGDGDCSFCRPEGHYGSCRTDVEYADGEGPAVCVPP